MGEVEGAWIEPWLLLVVWPLAIVLAALMAKIAWHCFRQERWTTFLGIIAHALVLAVAVWDVILNFGVGDYPWTVAATAVAVALSYAWTIGHLAFPGRWIAGRIMLLPGWVVRVFRGEPPVEKRHRVDRTLTR
jgi:hypothetical protein